MSTEREAGVKIRGSFYAADGRWRLPGGKHVHRAVVRPLDRGTLVVLLCDVEVGRWWDDGEVVRLGLDKDGEEATCPKCERAALEALATTESEEAP